MPRLKEVLRGGLDSTLHGSALRSPSDASVTRAEKLKAVPKKWHAHYEIGWAGNSRKAAIRAFCLECMSFDTYCVENCEVASCPLHSYRKRG